MSNVPPPLTPDPDERPQQAGSDAPTSPEAQAAAQPDVPGAPVPPPAPEPPAAPSAPPGATMPPPGPGAQSYGAPQSPYGASGASPYATPPAGPGGPNAPYSYSQPGAGTKAPVLSIISLIAGIVGVIGSLAVVWIPIIGGILQLFIPAAAVVLGFLGKKREPWASKGLWLTGIILGFAGIAIGLISIIAWIALFAAFGNSGYTYNY
ncbi:DUF4190 domain-containing protein [Ruicaihuangia caeni]|uniref:DUF4190 domain-containing protein n=1 Tax=Ruicaihuangia caeni TaxID=3042517 RepID=A0AAW6T598_9MICO|nr:hypothetical protein [Klugiella sp. YN-L-19]MDI2098624.1 hypothetical protein [Klugiella sp. YN-L-19]